ncbi:hypothetical protein GCM10023221_35070 [Luteimicrobium xylanilyticum]
MSSAGSTSSAAAGAGSESGSSAGSAKDGGSSQSASGSGSPGSSGSSHASTAPNRTFALGTRIYTLDRAGRTIKFKVFYPRTGDGTQDVAEAPIASGTFPLVLFSHGLGGNPDSYSSLIAPLAKAGFVVAAPWYPNTTTGSSGNVGDAMSGNQSLDASAVISRMLDFDKDGSSPFHDKIDTSHGVGASGHSLGAITTQGLLGAKKDSRVTTAVMLATASIGKPTGSPVKTLFINGDQDPLTAYSGARSAYDAVPWPKAFMTHVGGNHDRYVWFGEGYDETVATLVDWMRWGLYGDAGAKARLPHDASGKSIRWESKGL